MKSKRMILILFTLLCIVSIFCFSSQEKQESEKVSDHVASSIIDTTAKVTKTEIKEEKKEELVKNSRFLIRKTAHFTIYFLLGVCFYLTLKSFNVKHSLLLSIVFCFCYACSDEIHQLFVSERAGQIQDVILDTVGAAIGIFFTSKITNWFLKRKRKSKNIA